MGAAVAACEAVWLKMILRDLRVPITDLIPLYCDNMSNIHLARNPVFHACTKHIEVHYHFIREMSTFNISSQIFRQLTSSPKP